MIELELQYAEQPPPEARRDWGLTVACGERRHDKCGGTRMWRTFITGELRTAGRCTCPCH